MRYLRNTWYQVAWSDEIGEQGAFTRRVLDTPLLLFRTDRGEVVAMLDCCPHRFSPLSRGVIDGRTVTCGYHGLQFDVAGQCVRNPHGPIPPRVRVQTFPVRERHDAVWIWLGEPEIAEHEPVTDFGFIDATPVSAKFHGLMPTQANYQLISDNLLDLSHISFLHRETFGGILGGARMTLETSKRSIKARWTSEGFEPEPESPYRAFVPVGKADIAVTATWTPPSQVIITNTAVAAGQTPGESDQILALHSLTPETSVTTHYFYCVTRRFNTDDPELTRIIKTSTEAAFTLEDKPMIEAQQQRMTSVDLLAQDPLLLPIDAASIRVRRMLQQMIDAETSPASDSVAQATER